MIESQLHKLVELREKIISNSSEDIRGTLWADATSRREPKYYIWKDGVKKYVKKSDIDIARAMAQQEYDKLILLELEKQIRISKQYTDNCDIKKLVDIYDNIPSAKKVLIKPYILPDDEYIKQWEQKSPGEVNTYESKYPIITEKGETVRSKSEKLIADKLFYNNIPYKYEAKLVLGNKIVFPDFTILNVRTRKQLYYEHFGKMADEEYFEDSFLYKNELYTKHNLLLGRDWIATFESDGRVLDMRQVDILIKNYMV